MKESENIRADNQYKKQNYEWLKPYQWKKGESGNLKGRPPGKSLKTFVKDYLLSLPDEEKLKFLNHVNPEFAWRMAEGNPKEDVKHSGEIKNLTDEQIKRIISREAKRIGISDQ